MGERNVITSGVGIYRLGAVIIFLDLVSGINPINHDLGPNPNKLLGYWRGLMVKDLKIGEFDIGELDMHFGPNNLTVLFANGSSVAFTVGATPDYLILNHTQTNLSMKVLAGDLVGLRHTTAMGFATRGPG